MRNILLSTTAACLTAFTTATFANNSALHVIGWQNFDTVSPGLNDSGINDDSPDTNSTFDATPIGTHADNLYLSGKIGLNASTLGYKGLGNKVGLATLNDGDYGPSLSGANIVDYPQSTNKAGEISSVKSSWKFNASNSNGDFTIINNSIYVFRVRDILFDALSASDFSGKVLEINYVGGGENEELINANTNSEVEDGKLLFRYDFANIGNNALTLPAPTTVGVDPAFTDNKFIPFATNQVAGSETAQTFEFVVEGVVPAGATYQIKKTTNAAGTAWNTATFDLVPGTTTRTVAAPGGGFTRKVNVVFSSGDVYISSFKHNGVEQLTTTSQITHSLSDYGPIWLKEFAVKRTQTMIDNGENFPAADVSAFMENLLRKLNTDPEVFRYAWFNSNDPTSEYYPRQVDSLIFDINSLQTTALGDYYKTVNGPSYEVKESTTVDALAGSSTVSAVATNNHSTWTHKVSVASGTGSGAEQVIELDVVSLPTGGANYRIVKTNLNGNNVFGTAKPLTTGLNTITVTGTAFERTVTLQFNSGDITISGCSINGVELLNKAFGNINNGPLTISIPDSDYARSLNVEFSSSSIEVDSFKLNDNELTAIAVEGYYPLYDTETAANFVGDGTSHTHTLGGVTYYMPNGLTLGETMFHGNYTGE